VCAQPHHRAVVAVSLDYGMGFKRVEEDFTCEHCSAHVTGTGYTNHCPRCLWSKHVDVTPGDRANECAGLMEPHSVEGTTDSYVITHRCTRCGALKRNKVMREDDLAAVVALAQRTASR